MGKSIVFKPQNKTFCIYINIKHILRLNKSHFNRGITRSDLFVCAGEAAFGNESSSYGFLKTKSLTCILKNAQLTGELLSSQSNTL